MRQTKRRGLSRGRWGASGIAVLAAFLTAATADTQGGRPNVLVVIADDMGWGDLSTHGNQQVETPRIDSLSADGVSFERFYVQPVCAPTRAEFLTGRHHPRVGVIGVSTGRERLDAEVPTIADAFRAAGYATGLFGKWHNGTQPPRHPICRGFDEFYGFTSGHWGHYFDFWLDHNNQMVTGRGYAPNDFTDHAIDFMAAEPDKPFFAMVTFNTPHSPMQVPDRWWERHADQSIDQRGTDASREDVVHTRAALAMCENIDWNLGRMLDRLEELGVAENTIVVFFSDNGPNGHRWTGGMRGVKAMTDEGGVRSPLFVRLPARLPPGAVVESPACVLDLPPTLAALCGVSLAEPDELDGLDLSPWMLGAESGPIPSRTIFAKWAKRLATRRGDYVLDDQGRLYDLSSDPSQTRDIASAKPDIAGELAQERDAWCERVGLNDPAEPDPFTVGHAEHATTHLPVRDATAVGSLVRSNRYPNCTYFSGWSGPEDAVVWDVEVLTPGVYTPMVYLAVPTEAVGSELVLTAEATAVRVPLTAATDCAPIGLDLDLVPRVEGPVMPFRRLDAPPIELRAGRQELRMSLGEGAAGGPFLWQLSLERQ